MLSPHSYLANPYFQDCAHVGYGWRRKGISILRWAKCLSRIDGPRSKSSYLIRGILTHSCPEIAYIPCPSSVSRRRNRIHKMDNWWWLPIRT
jgi:hypothetical protein